MSGIAKPSDPNFWPKWGEAYLQAATPAEQVQVLRQVTTLTGVDTGTALRRLAEQELATV